MTTLYRFYAPNDVLLYVGIAGTPHVRWEEHRARQRWWRDACKVTMEHFDDRKEALAAETRAIRDERPLYNRTHRPDVTVRPRRSGPYRAADIAFEVQEGIVSGEYPVGARLPSMSEMARAYNVSTGTIRSARIRLKRERWIDGDHTKIFVLAKRSKIPIPRQLGPPAFYLAPDGVDPESREVRRASRANVNPDHPE